MVSVILTNLKRFVQPCLLGLFCVFFLLQPVLAQSAADVPAESNTTEHEPQYVSGQVTEIVSETTVQDEAFNRQEKKIRFKVHFAANGPDPEETILLEQSYSLDTPAELLPSKGKHFIFYKETMVDNTHAYTLIDVQRLNHVPWIALLVSVLLILFGRWFGIKSLLIAAAMFMSFSFFNLIKLPWLLNSFVSCLLTMALTCFLSFGMGPRLIASLSACLGGAVITSICVWLSGLFAVSSPSVLLSSGMILQMSAGISFIAISTIQAVQAAWKQEPGLSRKALFQKSMVAARPAIETVSSLFLLIFIGQILTSVYSQGGEMGILQMEPVLTGMASLLFMLIGFVLTLPISAWIGARFQVQSHR